MSFIRRLFGRQRDQAQGDPRLRRSAHVTPSQASAAPASDEEKAQPAPPAEAAPAPAAPPLRQDQSPAAAAQPDASQMPAGEEPAAAPKPEPAARPAPPAFLAPMAGASLATPRMESAAVRQLRQLTYGIASDVGRLRENNEDACFGAQWHVMTIDDLPNFGLFIVADGMGGHLDGERAAGAAVQTMAADVLKRVHAPMLHDPRESGNPSMLDSLVSAAESANLAVLRQAPGGGTTLTAVAIVGNLAYLAHVGDSRAYLAQGGKIEQLTTDHTLVQRLIQMKELTPQQAEQYPQKNVLYRAIGQREELRVERMIRALPPGARIVICTDGLWDMVDDETIGDVAQTAATPQEACDKLVKLANERGGADNITVIAVNLPDEPTRQ